MDLEAIIAVSYLTIGFFHFVIYLMKEVKHSHYYYHSDPMDLFTAAFVWPLVDVLWLTAKAKRNRDKTER